VRDRYSLYFLWNLSMRKPFKARMEHWEEEAWYECHGISPIGQKQSYGFTENGIGVGFETDQPIWRKV